MGVCGSTQSDNGASLGNDEKLEQNLDSLATKLTFEEVIGSEKLLDAFEAFTRREFCEKNLLFFLAVRELQRTVDRGDGKRAIELSKSIWDAHMRVGSDFEITITPKTRKDVETRLQDMGAGEEAYAPAMRVAMHSLRYDQFTRYRMSPEARKAVEK